MSGNISGGLDFDVFQSKVKMIAVEMLSVYVDGIYNQGQVPSADVKFAGLRQLVDKIASGYNEVAYHNFYHAVDVAQMVFSMLQSPRLKRDDLLSKKHKFFLIFVALCHDIGHFGIGNKTSPLGTGLERVLIPNGFPAPPPAQAAAWTWPRLERFHIDKTLALLDQAVPPAVSLSLFYNLPQNTALAPNLILDLKKWCICLILATDLGLAFGPTGYNALIKTNAQITDRAVAPDFPAVANQAMPPMLAHIIIKAADLGNAFRSSEVTTKWTAFVVQEGVAATKVMAEFATWLVPANLTEYVDKMEMEFFNMRKITDGNGDPSDFFGYVIHGFLEAVREFSAIAVPLPGAGVPAPNPHKAAKDILTFLMQKNKYPLICTEL